MLDVRVGPTVDETVDVFPAQQPGAPILVFIHGGWWRSRSSKDFNLVARGPSAHGVTVVVSNYSLCPKVTIAEITRQSRAVIAWLSREARSFNGDPERIFVCGHSAGGHQVGMLVATDWPGEAPQQTGPTLPQGSRTGQTALVPFAGLPPCCGSLPLCVSSG